MGTHPGEVRINGTPIQAKENVLKGLSGFVPQDDLLVEDLTVFENLYFNARLCFRDLPDAEIREQVENVLSSLGLTEKQNMKVGSPMNKTISGGQRKRLNIALELVREPAILFLDEPTSGLSSRDSEHVMDLLRELTIRGKLIFVVIHQPSSELFKMFDQVLILDTGGKLVYFGNPVEAVIHFKKADSQVNAGKGECPVCGNVNPEMIFNILEARQVDDYGNDSGHRKVSPQTWQALFEESREKEEVTVPDGLPGSALRIPRWRSQILTYFLRDLKSKIANTQYLVMTLLVSPVLALILAYLVRYIADPASSRYIFRENENIPIFLFMALIVALFLGLILSAEEIFKDRKILKREQFLNLSRSAYLVAKVVILFLLSAIQTIVFVWIANGILEIRFMTLPYWLVLFSTAACANMIGLLISSTFSSAVTIYIVIPLVMIPMMVLSGAMFSFEKLNRKVVSADKVPLVAEFMPTRWGYEALMVHQFKANEFEKTFFEDDKQVSVTNFRSAYLLPQLEERLRNLKAEFARDGRIESTRRDLVVLEHEIKAFDAYLTDAGLPVGDWNAATPSPEFFDGLEKALSILRNRFLEQYTAAISVKERRLGKIMRDRKPVYYQMLDQYHNEAVADQVRKIYEKHPIVEYKGRLIRQSEPVFLDPPAGFPGIRSHFFAPRKYLLGRYVDTFGFNVGFIWVLTLLAYLFLYYDLPGRLIRWKGFGKNS
ncbi:MAG: ABC transporter permease [Bacteroidales bacterium]